jgi:hypothetical protein
MSPQADDNLDVLAPGNAAVLLLSRQRAAPCMMSAEVLRGLKLLCLKGWLLPKSLPLASALNTSLLHVFVAQD